MRSGLNRLLPTRRIPPQNAPPRSSNGGVERVQSARQRPWQRTSGDANRTGRSARRAVWEHAPCSPQCLASRIYIRTGCSHEEVGCVKGGIRTLCGLAEVAEEHGHLACVRWSIWWKCARNRGRTPASGSRRSASIPPHPSVVPYPHQLPTRRSATVAARASARRGRRAAWR